MTLQEWLHLFMEQIAGTDTLQWIAVSLGIAEVLLARANKIALYPTGIAATALSIFILYEAGLYAECTLNGYYIVMSVFGWWYWVHKKDRTDVKISRCSKKEWITAAAIVVISFALFYFFLKYGVSYSFLKKLTPSTVPVWDAWVSATAWAGMWLLAKRKLENWILLNISNAFAVPLLFHKQLPLFACLTIFLFIVAVQGYFKWRKTIINEQSASLQEAI